MGIKLQSATLVEPFEYISLTDDALDGEHEDFADEFQRYRDGTVKSPPLKDGCEPMRWELQPITDATLRGILDGIREENGRSSLLIATACLGIVGWTGAPKELGKIRRPRNRDGYPCLDKKQQDMIGAEVLVELGTALALHAIPNPD